MFRRNNAPQPQPTPSAHPAEHSFDQFLAQSPAPVQPPVESLYPSNETAGDGYQIHPEVKRLMGIYKASPQNTAVREADAIARERRQIQLSPRSREIALAGGEDPFGALRAVGAGAYPRTAPSHGNYQGAMPPNFGSPYRGAEPTPESHRIKDILHNKKVKGALAAFSAVLALSAAVPKGLEAYSSYNAKRYAAQVKKDKVDHPSLMAATIPCTTGGAKVATANFNAVAETKMPLPIVDPKTKAVLDKSYVTGPAVRYVSSATINACGLLGDKKTAPLATFDSQKRQYVINRAAAQLVSANIAEQPCNATVGKDPQVPQLCFVGTGGSIVANDKKVDPATLKTYQTDAAKKNLILSYIGVDPTTKNPIDANGRKIFESVALVKTRASILSAFESSKCVGLKSAIDKAIGDIVLAKVGSQKSLDNKSLGFIGNYVAGMSTGYENTQKTLFADTTIDLGNITIKCATAPISAGK